MSVADLLEGEVGVVVKEDRQAVGGVELRERLDEHGIVRPGGLGFVDGFV